MTEKMEVDAVAGANDEKDPKKRKVDEAAGTKGDQPEAGAGGGSGGAVAAGAPGGDTATSGPGTITVTNKDGVEMQIRLPLNPGDCAECKRRDGEVMRVRIIERRPAEALAAAAAAAAAALPPGAPGPSDPSPSDTTTGAPGPNDWDYYVHYIGYNRRMDEWVTHGQLDLCSVEQEAPDPPGGPDDPKRKQKKKVQDHESDSEHADFDPAQLREHEEFTKVKNIEAIELGRHVMDTWYFSPFPPEFKDCKHLHFCEFSLHFFKRKEQLQRHLLKCPLRHPPGTEIYRNGPVCMFEVDGKREKTYCQHLCYLAKLFLDHKTLYYDVDLFLFYVLCELDERGAHIVGYFSKEKSSEEGYNLACILTLPAYQRKGYGKFLISMSYELSKIESKVGTPERPLSDLGRVSYHGYWTRVLLTLLRDHEGTVSIKDLSEVTAIKTDDIINTFQTLGLIQYQKGQHVIVASPKLIDKHLKAAGSAGLVVDPAKIVWTPYNAEREYANYRG